MSHNIFIPRWRLEVRTSRSSGPGGQNVNKTETKVEIRFALDEADWIPPAVKSRFQNLNANRITKDGEFVLSSEKHRSQSQNLEEAIEKLQDLLQIAATPPKPRVKTKATRSSKRKRLDSKKLHGAVKKQRGRIREGD